MKAEKILKWKWFILGCSLSIWSVTAFAQIESSKVYTAEIDVSPGVTVFTTGPRALPVNMHGTMTMDETDYAFTVRGKGEEPALVLVKKLEVLVWDKNKVRQESEVVVGASNGMDIARIEKLLKVTLSEQANKVVVVDCNLNIQKFRLRNGFFMKDKSWLELEDGSSLPLNSLELKTKIYVPRNSNFKIEGNYVDLQVGKLAGDLHASIEHGSLNVQQAKNINLHTISSDIYLGQIGYAKINARGCKIGATRIEELMIENQPIILMADPLFDLDEDDAHSSALNKYNLDYVGQLTALVSENDQFILNTVGEMNVTLSVFSNFTINRLEKRLQIGAKSGDLVIANIEPDFEGISINNEISTVRLGLEQLKNYQLEINEGDQLSYEPPKSARMIDSKTTWKKTFARGNHEQSGEIEINCKKCRLFFD